MPTPTAEELGFDPEALRRKYRAERDKRMRPEGEAQFLATSGEYADYFEKDPYADENFHREPLKVRIPIAIIGGGFAGLITAARLIEAGYAELRILEIGADFGGTWYWNRYPGAQCDIESYCYLPMLEETGYMPKEKYSFAPEIHAHLQRIAKNYGLYDRAILQTEVKSIHWSADEQRWSIETNRGDDIRAQFVISATGPAFAPRLPGIPGIRDFEGRSFHTSRWDYEYTGGDNTGNLDKLADKTVAVIGTGATAIQCVPHVGAAAKHLYVFQRTPSSVDERGNSPTDPAWAKSLKPGWQKARQENFNEVVTGHPFRVDLVNDGWTDIFRNLQNVFLTKELDATGLSPEETEEMAQIADFQKMNQVRARVDAVVNDPEVAELLKPWYRQFCKRPTFNDEYLPTFNRPNVTLVDTTPSHGVERITKNGVVANGVEYPVDCIIFATGFEISSAYERRMRYQVQGEGGQSVYDHWKAGRRTLHGHSCHGFPNWFIVGSSQNGVSVNYSSMVEGQVSHLTYILDQVRARNAASVQPTAEAEAAWVDEIRREAMNVAEFFDACTPGYYNNEGKHRETAATLTGDAYAPGVNVFNALLEQWRSDGKCEGLAFN